MTRLVLASTIFQAALFSAPVGGPTLGLIHDHSASSLRIIQGIPGAATLSSPIANVPAGAQVSLSETATTAALYVAGDSAISLLTNLPATPTTTEVPLPAPATHIAIADDATLLFSTSEALFRLTAAGDLRRIAAIQPASITLLNHGSAALLTTADGIWRIDDLAGSPKTTLLAPAAAQAAALVGQILLYVAEQTLTALDLSTGMSANIACACQPTTLEPLASPNTYRQTENNTSPVCILETDHTLFIPGVSQ
jgi:hypothetical protein